MAMGTLPRILPAGGVGNEQMTVRSTKWAAGKSTKPFCDWRCPLWPSASLFALARGGLWETQAQMSIVVI